MKDSKTNAFISKAEWANNKFSRMTMLDCINMWNDKAVDHYCKYIAMHEMSDEKWWNSLSVYLGAWDLIHVVMHAGEDFNDSDMWFFYDEDAGMMRSFSTKQELIDKVGKDFFIDQLMEQKMNVCEHGRTWEVLEHYDLIDADGKDWFVGDFDGVGTLYMNNMDGYMVLFEKAGRILKADI